VIAHLFSVISYQLSVNSIALNLIIGISKGRLNANRDCRVLRERDLSLSLKPDGAQVISHFTYKWEKIQPPA
jgi:hypothetical protein